MSHIERSATSPNMEEVEEFRSLVSEAALKANGPSLVLSELNEKICDNEGDGDNIVTKNGLGFLELKNMIMLEYVSDLTLLLMMKSRGKKIEGAKAIERIVENRTVLEKMRPIEKKLKYQIDKYVKVAESGGKIRPEDPIHFKPNPSALAADESAEESDENEGLKGEKESGNQLYRVPKNIPTLCEDDANSKREAEMEERAVSKKRTLSKSLLDDLRRQHLDTPEEEYHQSDTLKAKHVALLKERTRCEEDNFMRLPQMSKKEKHKLGKRSMMTMGNVADEITLFGKNIFYNKPQDGKTGKRKHKGTSKGGKSGGKKFRRN
jgi:U3 small nucleolar ribonucleoprotein protein LCP5